MDHSVNTLKTWIWLWNGSITRKWPEKAKGLGIECKDFRRMTRAEFERTDFMSREGENLCVQIEVPEIPLIKD